ncbi:MAG: PAS domain S-box protein [Bacteroidales bacterium]|nr:PAS domain S-box protein [Bacteroidales bacterium]
MKSRPEKNSKEIDKLNELEEKYSSLKNLYERDIAHLKKAEEALLISQANLQSLINNKEESIWSLDKNYCLIVCNDFFRNSYLAAYGVEIGLGTNLVEILSPELRAYWKPKYDEALKGRKVSFEFDETFLGQHFYFNVYLNPIYSDGIITGVTALSVDITEGKKTEEELRESETRFSQLANSSFEGIGISDKGIIIDANDQLLKLLGYSHDELIGLNALEFVAPESRDMVMHHMLNNFEAPYEHMALRKDGTTFPVEIQARAVTFKGRNLRVTAIRDITSRKLAEESLREANQKIKLHFEQTPMAVIEWNPDFCVSLWNPAAQNIFGYSKEEAIGKHGRFIIPEAEQTRIDTIFSQLMQNSGGERSTNKNITKDGRIIFCDWYNTPLIDENGNVKGVASMVEDITSRKLAETALQESERKFRQFIETAFEGIIAADKNDRITFTNRKVLEMLKYSEEELRGMKISDFFLEEDLQDYQSRMKKRKKGYAEVIERRYKRKDGSVFWALVSASPIINENGDYTGSLGMITDITDQKTAIEILRQSEERFRSVAETANDAIITANHKGIILFWNTGAENIFGYKPAEIIGKSFTQIIPELFLEKFLDGIRNIGDVKTKPKGRTIELNGLRKSKEEFPAEISLSKWQTATGKFYTSIIRDITRRKNVEEALILAKEKAEESDRLKSSFLANMSHEIRTPMNGILGFAELLKNRTLSGHEQSNYLSIIESSGRRMLNIINDLIDISKIEAGQADIAITHCNLNKKMQFIHSFFQPEAISKGISLILHTGLDDSESDIQTDVEKINAILINLVKNALKFTSEGEINFGYVKKGNILEFFVKDTGIGIPEPQQGIIFERFRQGSESLTRNYEGAGLGLSISRSFVKMLNGEIWVESNSAKTADKNTGSAFYFTIPYVPGPEIKEESSAYEENDQREKTGQLIKILITEDDDASRNLLKLYITSFCPTPLFAANGMEAVELCRSHPDIDLILMDLKMPVMNGYDACREIRKFNKNVRIIAQTAFARPDELNGAIEAGCNDYITKPVKKSELSEIIEKYR